MLTRFYRQGQFGVDILDHKELEEHKRWSRLSLSEKVKDWSLRHQYTLIMGGWAGSLGLAAAVISRNKYQTFPQKVSAGETVFKVRRSHR